MKYVWVIAPTYIWFLRDIKSRAKDEKDCLVRNGIFKVGDTTYKYVSSPRDLQGLHGVEIEFIGNWFNRSDADELSDLAKRAREL